MKRTFGALILTIWVRFATQAVAQDRNTASTDPGTVHSQDPSQTELPELEVHGGDHSGLQLSLGDRRITLPGWDGKPTKNVALTSAARFTSPGGAELAALTLTTPSGPYGAVLQLDGSIPIVRWEGSLAAQGDPGEKVAQALRVVPFGVHIGPTDQRVRLCGTQQLPLLQAQQVDEKGPHPVPVLRATQASSLSAQVVTGVPESLPHLALLTPRRSFGDGGQADISWPSQVLDGDQATGWSVADGSDTLGPFLSFGWDSQDFPLQSVALGFSHPGPLPQRVRLHLDTGIIDAPVPAAPSEGAEAPHGTPQNAKADATQGTEVPQVYWVRITPAHPVQTSCLSVELLDAPAGTRLVEVAGYSEFDGPQGELALQRALQGDTSNRAAQLLAQSGASVLPWLLARWRELPIATRVTLIPVLVPHVANPQVAHQLATALADTAPVTVEGGRALPGQRPTSLQAALVAALTRRRDPATLAWIGQQLAAGVDGSGSLAANAAATAPPTFVGAVLEGLATASAPESPQLQQALTTLCRRFPAETLTSVQTWAEGHKTLSTSSAARVGLVGAHCWDLEASDEQSLAGRELVLRLAQRARQTGRNGDFVARYWAVRVASVAPASSKPVGTGDAPPDDANANFLVEVATDDDTWMLRDAALEGLAQLRSPSAESTALLALDDAYPRVRARAVRVLSELAPETPRLLRHLRTDTWHLVRIAALESLPDSPGLRAGIAQRLHDPIRDVRLAALERATALGDAAVAEEVLTRLRNRKEALAVRLGALEYVGQLCVEQALTDVEELAYAGLLPTASEASVELALAAHRVLARFGRPLTGPALDGVKPSPTLRAALTQATSVPSSCGQPDS